MYLLFGVVEERILPYRSSRPYPYEPKVGFGKDKAHERKDIHKLASSSRCVKRKEKNNTACKRDFFLEAYRLDLRNEGFSYEREIKEASLETGPLKDKPLISKQHPNELSFSTILLV